MDSMKSSMLVLGGWKRAKDELNLWNTQIFFHGENLNIFWDPSKSKRHGLPVEKWNKV